MQVFANAGGVAGEKTRGHGCHACICEQQAALWSSACSGTPVAQCVCALKGLCAQPLGSDGSCVTLVFCCFLFVTIDSFCFRDFVCLGFPFLIQFVRLTPLPLPAWFFWGSSSTARRHNGKNTQRPQPESNRAALRCEADALSGRPPCRPVHRVSRLLV